MLFLIEYDRRAGKLLSMQRFADTERKHAYDLAFTRELAEMKKKEPHEIVLLEAESEEVIRVTHARYFETLEELARRLDEHLCKCIIKKQIPVN